MPFFSLFCLAAWAAQPYFGPGKALNTVFVPLGKLEDGKGAIFEGQSFFKEHFWFGSGDNGFKVIHYTVYGR